MSQFKTIEELRNAVGVVPTPFASAPFSTVEIPDTDTSSVELNFKDGFPSTYGTKIIESDGSENSDARVITRSQVNTIGNIGSQTQFFEQCGGYYTFDPEICAKINGYPKGAILRFYDEETNSLRTVKSVKDNNTDNFLIDRTFIKNLNYADWQVGDHASWVYVDDNPEVGVVVDYSDFEDISNNIFISTGVADLYEIPYDGYLQMWGLGYISCAELRRPDSQDVTLPLGWKRDETRTRANESFDTWNSMFFCSGKGTSFIDVYSKDASAFYSLVIGGFFPFEWAASIPGYIGEDSVTKHFTVLCPVSPFSCGFFVSKGQKVKIRNELVTVNVAESTKVGYLPDQRYTDVELRRTYLQKYAKLFKVRYRA